jgi:hypothetical protein
MAPSEPSLAVARTDDCGPRNLLAQLDAQQNKVIEELDELNERIEGLLRQCSQERSAKAA